MASSSESTHAETGIRTLATRIIGWHWKWPVLLAIALLFILLVAVVGMHSIFGDDPILEKGQGALGLGRHLRTDFVLVLVSAFTFWTGLAGLAKATREFDRLRQILRLDDPIFDFYRDQLCPNPRGLIIAALIGGSAGTGLYLSSYISSSTIRLSHTSLHSLPFTVLLFASIGMLALITYRQSQVFRVVGQQYVEVDLLDPGILSPFAAVGLMNAGFWFIGSAIASLLATGLANLWIVVMVILITTGFGVAGLIVPSSGLHTRIQQRKRDELAQIRDAIVNERAALFSTAEHPHMPPKMHAMLAYEARIESVREWPFDTSTLSRFAFFLLIPLVSWIGGALVERAVDAALR